MSDFMNNLNKVGMILQAGGGSLAGRDGMGVVREYQAQQEEERKRAAISGLLGQSGIGGAQRALIDTLPVADQQAYLLGEFDRRAQMDALMQQQRMSQDAFSSYFQPAAAAPMTPGQSVAKDAMATVIRQGLLERGLPPHVADAFVVNMKDESGLDPSINEIAPLVPGSRGGFGLAQWTGPRRVALEQFAASRGTPVSDLNTQLDFLVAEMQGPEARAGQAILSTKNVADAAQVIVNDFLRPAPNNRARRANAYAQLSPEAVARAIADPRLTDQQREAIKFAYEQQPRDEFDPDRYRVVGNTLYDLADLDENGRPRAVAESAGQQEVVFGPDGQPIVARGPAGADFRFTEAQGKDNVYATRAEGALALLDSVGAEAMADRSAIIADSVPFGLARGLQPEAFQVAQQAGNEFLQAILRKDTGAAITADEQALYGQTFLPQPGDQPQVLEAKRQARIRALEALKSGMNIQQLTVTQRALIQAAERAGHQSTGYADTPIVGGRVQPPETAIDILRSNPSPEYRQYFDEVFGEGAAARALGQ